MTSQMIIVTSIAPNGLQDIVVNNERYMFISKFKLTSLLKNTHSAAHFIYVMYRNDAVKLGII